ncbi:hypothetical protein K438DRAFT_1767491 [Mycena galopus ATCC 62051]|nr:hypothetical protein K438DRAFT_1767491 [Mycena galopus ATCC 62051]
MSKKAVKAAGIENYSMYKFSTHKYFTQATTYIHEPGVLALLDSLLVMPDARDALVASVTKIHPDLTMFEDVIRNWERHKYCMIVTDSPPALSPLGVPESGCTLHSHAQNPAPITQQPVALAPSYGGGNFIDHSLKVCIIQAAGTLLGHKLTYKHSTTPLCGTLACGGTIPFTARIKEEFEKMME